MRNLSKIQEVLRTKGLFRFKRRRIEDASFRGYCLDIGPRFFLLANVSDRIWFDGFECLRLGDLSAVEPDPYSEFTESALRKRRERLPAKPDVSVATLEELVQSAGRVFPLVTIHRETVDPDVCWIGRIVSVEKGRLSLLEISPNAIWEENPSTFLLKEITRVGFGGDYEKALHLVGKGPDRLKSKD